VGSEDRGVGIFWQWHRTTEDIQRQELVPLLFLCERTGQDVFQVNHDKGIGPVGSLFKRSFLGEPERRENRECQGEGDGRKHRKRLVRKNQRGIKVVYDRFWETCAQYLCALEQEFVRNSCYGVVAGLSLPLETLEKAGKKGD